MELGLGFSWYIKGWSRLAENNEEERSIDGGPGPASTTCGQANHGGISGFRLKLWCCSCSLFSDSTAWRPWLWSWGWRLRWEDEEPGCEERSGFPVIALALSSAKASQKAL